MAPAHGRIAHQRFGRNRSSNVRHGAMPTRDNTMRVAAQVVSGIGFLDADVITGEGLTVRGLNTAATLWCSAAVGTLSALGKSTWQRPP